MTITVTDEMLVENISEHVEYYQILDLLHFPLTTSKGKLLSILVLYSQHIYRYTSAKTLSSYLILPWHCTATKILHRCK